MLSFSIAKKDRATQGCDPSVLAIREQVGSWRSVCCVVAISSPTFFFITWFRFYALNPIGDQPHAEPTEQRRLDHRLPQPTFSRS